jgi:hypothetical protein
VNIKFKYEVEAAVKKTKKSVSNIQSLVNNILRNAKKLQCPTGLL